MLWKPSAAGAWKMVIEGEACLLGALLLLTVPLSWLLAAILAALWHELWHLLAVWAVGGQVLGLTVGAGGIRMDVSPLRRPQELICALAGPAGSLLLLLFAGSFPRVALCGFCQGAFNLLPVYPLDGGRVLRCLFPGRKWVQHLTLAGAVVITLMLFGILPAGVVLLTALPRKNPCK